MRVLRLKILYGLVLPCLFLLIWQHFAVEKNNPALIPRVEAVVSVLAHGMSNIDELGTSSLAWNTIISLFRVFCGFFLAVIVGVPLGIAMGYSRRFYAVVNPFVEMFRPLCPIAWIPFAMAVFGLHSVINVFGIRYSDTILDTVQLAQLFIIFYGGFFPVLLNTVHSVKSVKKLWIESARSLGATRGQILVKIIAPASLPAVLTGIRIGLGVSWMVIIAAEMFPGPDLGIGYVLMYAADQGEMAIVVACMFVIGLIGLVINNGLQSIAGRISGWQALER